MLRDSGTSKDAARTGALHVVRVLSVQGDDAASLACCGALAAITGRGDEDQIKLVARDGAAPVPVHLALTHDVLVARAGAVVDTVLVAPVKLIRKIFHEEHFIFRSPTRIDPIHFLNIQMVRIQIFSPR